MALGSKNYLFAGSDLGGQRAAVNYNLLGSAKLNGMDPGIYLSLVLRRIADHPINRELGTFNLCIEFGLQLRLRLLRWVRAPIARRKDHQLAELPVHLRVQRRGIGHVDDVSVRPSGDVCL